MSLRDDYMRAATKLAAWRAALASWQLGTRPSGDGEVRALKDHREVTILMRAELNALVGVLIDKGVFTDDEWLVALISEMRNLDRDYEKKFPGFSTTQEGLRIDPRRARDTMRRMGFPQ